MSLKSFQRKLKVPTTPAVSTGQRTNLVTAVTTAAAKAFTTAGSIDVREARYLMLHLDVTPAAVGSLVDLYPLVTGDYTGAAGDEAGVDDPVPGNTADVWHGIAVTDGSVASAPLAGAVPVSMTITATPNVGVQTYSNLVLRHPTAIGTSDRIRITYVLYVAPYKWVQVLYGDQGAAGQSTVTLGYSLAA